ncbi:helix-turn-helix transcriptional regulator [Streptomyces sp. MBT53]|uniref:helix-turn-helix domain-containing protein n=1 Tax=Streptomyces sp. MBT53 TaxID=1488384 RepID=UPI0019114149|nr:helix-turn-helix transcriptional regulator [Streptomyces sp. MBT53]MBK6017601.1 helix-turn-helix transcriptional regulator [Streptomyces sp. MBT53]
MGKLGNAASTSEATLRITVAALMKACGENQTKLAKGLRITQGQVSRKQNGKAVWSMGDIDKLSAHYGVPVPDLLCGPSHAVSKLSPRRLADMIGGSQEVITV